MVIRFSDAGPADWPALLCLWWRNVRASHGFVAEDHLRAIGASLAGEYLPAMERVRLAWLAGPGAELAHGPCARPCGEAGGGADGGAASRTGGRPGGGTNRRPDRSTDGGPGSGAGGKTAGAAEGRLEGRPSGGSGVAGLAGGQVPALSVAGAAVPCPADGRLLAGFLGSVGARVEMLFVEPGLRGRGVGSALLEDFCARHGEVLLDVNEQNTAARAFYARRGFGLVGRSPLDGAGWPYPLLHLRRRSSPER